MAAMASRWFVLTDPQGRECAKSDADQAALAQYVVDHRCTMEELVRRRVALSDLQPWPADPMLLWRWSPARAARSEKAYAAWA